MTDEPNEVSDELGPHELKQADRLSAERPTPAAAFYGALGRHLAALDPHYGPRPPRLRLIVAGYLAGGSLLMALGGLSALGVV